MTEPSRRYHGLAHLGLLWARYRRFSASSDLRPRDATPIALAIAFYDAVYVGGAHDNEARSAALWLAISAESAVCKETNRRWIADTILATFDHLGARAALDMGRPQDLARQWFLDLTPLGEQANVFDANMADLSAEMPDQTEARRHEALMANLTRYAAVRPLFRCAILRAAFEDAAQRNLARHLQR